MVVHCYLNGVLHVICVSNPIAETPVEKFENEKNRLDLNERRLIKITGSTFVVRKMTLQTTPFVCCLDPKCSVVTNNDGIRDRPYKRVWLMALCEKHIHTHPSYVCVCFQPTGHQHFTHTLQHISHIGVGDKVWATIKRNCPNPPYIFPLVAELKHLRRSTQRQPKPIYWMWMDCGPIM